MCRAAVRSTRVSERQRLWTLYALVQFWIAIVLHAPKALSQALADARDNDDSVYPAAPATAAAFFAEVFRRFTAASSRAPRRGPTLMETQAAMERHSGDRVFALPRIASRGPLHATVEGGTGLDRSPTSGPGLRPGRGTGGKPRRRSPATAG
jgi:hypothetical protein